MPPAEVATLAEQRSGRPVRGRATHHGPTSLAQTAAVAGPDRDPSAQQPPPRASTSVRESRAPPPAKRGTDSTFSRLVPPVKRRRAAQCTLAPSSASQPSAAVRAATSGGSKAVHALANIRPHATRAVTFRDRGASTVTERREPHRRPTNQIYVGEPGCSETASSSEADARIRTADPFITSADPLSPPVAPGRGKPPESRTFEPPRWRPKTTNDNRVDPA
jgi:hypothetical protein